MKTQLLHLDPFDDPASTREKLRWVQADRVVLVWPPYGRILNRRLDLVLLQREASRHGARLGLVCHDPEVRQHADDLGLPVFDDPDRITADRWLRNRPAPWPPAPPPGPRPARPVSSPRRQAGPRRRGDAIRRAGWMALVVAALLAVAAVVGPVAAVELHPKLEPVEQRFLIRLAAEDPRSEGVAWIPSRRLETEVEAELRLAVSGSVLAPSGFSTGAVLFSNVGEAEIVIPEGTGLRTTGEVPRRFVTVERALLPAGAGSQVLVPVRAARAGSDSNVEAGALTAVEGPLGLRVTAVNPEPTSGGAEAMVPGVTAEDLTRARESLERQLLQEANARWADLLGPGEVLSPESIRVAREVDFESAPQVGEPSESIWVSLRLEVESTAYPAQALDQAVEAALRPALLPGREIFPGSIRIELTPVRSSSAEGWTYSVGAQASSFAPDDGASAASALPGRRRENAAEILRRTFDLVDEPQIRVWPTWWPWLPLLPWRIQLVWAEAAA